MRILGTKDGAAQESCKKINTARCSTLVFLLTVALFITVCAVFCLLGRGPVREETALPSSVGDAERPVVIIDAGHGGEDGGAVGVNGVYEKDLNLSVAETLRDMLVCVGVEVIMTRDTDVLLYDKDSDYKGRKKQMDLAARLEVARENPSALFVSIHMNAFPEERYSGAQVYYSVNRGESRALAERIRESVVNGLQPYNRRDIKAADGGIYLLDRMDNVSVLVECGFLSNSAECERLSDGEYRRELSFALFGAIYGFIFDKALDF